jgi:tetratricopeptide (TPR) repeat protein
MKRGLTFAAALAPCLLAACPTAQAQGIRADRNAIAIGGNVTSSTINIGVPPEQLAALVRQSADLSESQKKLITKLEQELDLNRRQIQTALGILGEANVEPENLATKLVEVAGRFKELLATAANQPGDTPAIVALKAEAQKAIDAGELAKADELLAAVEAEQRQALDLVTVNVAETAARRGEVAMTRLRYREAAGHFANAAALFAPRGPHEDKHIRYLEKEAGAFFRQGNDFGDNDALRSAIDRYRALIALQPRDRVPLKWATAQFFLGGTLSSLGEREKGTARFEEALAAYAEAQKEFTGERRPIDWAITETRRGYVLGFIGVRERGTARLDESVAAYREVVKILRRSRTPRQWASAQLNLGIALSRRGGLDRGTDRLEAAVAAIRRALEVYTRENDPLAWAAIHNNLGLAFDRLAAREGGTARSEEAIAAYREALKEWTRERVPTRWAGTQYNLASALAGLGRREGGTARLEQAIAAYDEALKEQSRERTPIDWARSSGGQGVALMRLAELTKNADMAERAVAQIEAALDAVRGGGHEPQEDSFERQLPRARDLAQRLRQSPPSR